MHGRNDKAYWQRVHLFNYYGAPDADRMIVAMGSVCDCVEETVGLLEC